MSRTTPVSAVSRSLQSPSWPRQTCGEKSFSVFRISPVSRCPAASGLQIGLQNRFLICRFRLRHARSCTLLPVRRVAADPPTGCAGRAPTGQGEATAAAVARRRRTGFRWSVRAAPVVCKVADGAGLKCGCPGRHGGRDAQGSVVIRVLGCKLGCTVALLRIQRARRQSPQDYYRLAEPMLNASLAVE